MKDWACVCRFGGVGDNLIASSILPLLAGKYRVEVISEAPNHVIFENNPYIDKLTLKTRGDLPQDGAVAWQKWFRDRAKEYAFFVNLSHSCENLLALQFGQTQFHWPQAWRQRHCNKSYLEAVHDICDLPYVFRPKFYPTDEEVQKAQTTRANLLPNGGPLIGWVVSGSRFDKIYPYAGQAIARIIEECGATVLLFGAPTEKDITLARSIGDRVRESLGSIDRIHAAIVPQRQDEWTLTEPGQRTKLEEKHEPVWPLRRSLTQIQFCDAIVGPDTGLLWAVAMEPIPKIVLLSHASPENITKHWKRTIALHADPARVPCHPCHLLHDDISTCHPNAERTAAACMADISAAEVVAAVKASLSN